nr:rRNA maturation RNase YbeY [Desulfobacterales bacterium]
MKILIEDRQDQFCIDHEKVKEKSRIILEYLGCHDGELSILILDDSQIEELNRTYLHREGPTNVMAFPMQEGPYGNITPGLLGDVVISIETAFQESKEADMSLEERLNQLLVHGILHLLGYDHEKTKKEAETMNNKAQELLQLL